MIRTTCDIRATADRIQLIDPNTDELQKDYEIIINQHMPHIFEVEV